MDVARAHPLGRRYAGMRFDQSSTHHEQSIDRCDKVRVGDTIPGIAFLGESRQGSLTVA